MSEQVPPIPRPTAAIPEQILLVGAGVVGRAIAEAHLSRGLSVFLADIDADNLNAAVTWLSKRLKISTSAFQPFFSSGQYIHLSGDANAPYHPVELAPHNSGLLIESIVEQLDAKREFVKKISHQLGGEFVIASNTSSLRLQDIAAVCHRPDRFSGMHFFMPIKGRNLVEVVRTRETSDNALNIVSKVALEIGKRPLVVRDSPALVVNRILTPYIIQGLSLLEMGASHSLILRMSREFGMPRSPLEMIDMIGTRTAFDAGRAAWQAFPLRIDPSPIIPGLIKKGLSGWAGGSGFYDYDLTCDPPRPSVAINSTAANVIARYQRNSRDWSEQETLWALSVPMWIEASCILAEKVTAEFESIELAMREGLGFDAKWDFFGFFDSLGNQEILNAIQLLGPRMKAMSSPTGLCTALHETSTATEATGVFAGLR